MNKSWHESFLFTNWWSVESQCGRVTFLHVRMFHMSRTALGVSAYSCPKLCTENKTKYIVHTWIEEKSCVHQWQTACAFHLRFAVEFGKRRSNERPNSENYAKTKHFNGESSASNASMYPRVCKKDVALMPQYSATYCSTLQNAATHHNTCQNSVWPECTRSMSSLLQCLPLLHVTCQPTHAQNICGYVSATQRIEPKHMHRNTRVHTHTHIHTTNTHTNTHTCYSTCHEPLTSSVRPEIYGSQILRRVGFACWAYVLVSAYKNEQSVRALCLRKRKWRSCDSQSER